MREERRKLIALIALVAAIFYHFSMTNPQDDTQEHSDVELVKLKELAARAHADLQNAKMRMEKEAQDIRMYAVQSLIEKLLPTVDNFQRAFRHLPEDIADNDWVKGLQATEQQLLADLASAGLTSISSLGETVDTNLHEVLQTAPGEKDIVVDVLQEGYMLHGKIIRPAKVIVGDGTATT